MLKNLLPLIMILGACSGSESRGDEAVAQSSSIKNNKTVTEREAQEAYEIALPALGDMTIFAIGRGEDTLAARPIAEIAILELSAARAKLLSSQTPSKAEADSASFSPFQDAPDDQLAKAKVLWATSRRTSCASVQIASCERRYDALLSVLAEAAGLDVDDQSDISKASKEMAVKYRFPSCASLRASDNSAETHLASFDTAYPAELVGEEAVEKLELTKTDLQSIGAYLSCVTGLTPNMPPEVADAALSLYSSDKHGKAAFVALDKLAVGSSQDAIFARAFAEQMRDYIKEPSE